MKFMIALATAMIAISAQAKTVATYTRDGATYTVEVTSKGTTVRQAQPACNAEMDQCFNQGGHVPGWLTDLNKWAAEHGGKLPVEACGEINQCPNEDGHVPQWMQQLNQWFMDHGFSANPADDIYFG